MREEREAKMRWTAFASRGDDRPMSDLVPSPSALVPVAPSPGLLPESLAASLLERPTLDTLVAAMGLDSEERKKDRTNVEVVATVKSGTGLVAGLLTTVDNKTGETKKTLLLPSGGVVGGELSRGAADGCSAELYRAGAAMIADRDPLVVRQQRAVGPEHRADVGGVKDRGVEVGVVPDGRRQLHPDFAERREQPVVQGAVAGQRAPL